MVVHVESLHTLRQMMRVSRRRVVYMRRADCLAHFAEIGRLLRRARNDLLPPHHRWTVTNFHHVRHFGAISATLDTICRRDLPRLHLEPFHPVRIGNLRRHALRVWQLSHHVGGGAQARLNLMLANRLLHLADTAEDHALDVDHLLHLIEDRCDDVREHLLRVADMDEA